MVEYLTFTAVVSAEPGVALTVAHETLALAAAAARTVLRHVFRHRGLEADFLSVAVVVVQRQEPMSGLQEVRHLFFHQRLMR